MDISKARRILKLLAETDCLGGEMDVPEIEHLCIKVKKDKATILVTMQDNNEFQIVVRQIEKKQS